MLEKRSDLVFLRNFFFLILFFYFFLNFSSALSVVPASISMNFVSGFEQTFDYQIFGAKPDKIYSLYLKGDLAEYATLNKNELKGDGTFKVTLSLPNSLEKPGKNILHVGVKESVDDELGGDMIGTAVEIIVLVSVYVPYPGKYVEISFSSEDVNLGEPLDFKLEAINRGKENVTISPRIEIFSNQTQEKIETLYLEDRNLETTQKISLHKTMDTSKYISGRYNSKAVVEYGGNSPSISESFFRIGDLLINLKNYTNLVILDGKIQKFNIELESEWNDKIDGVYANVIFSNQTSEILSFKTSSSELNPWEVRTITGYFDTNNFEEGKYNANITLFYYGKDVGKSSSKVVEVEFIKKSSSTLMIILISLSVAVVIIGVFVVFLLKGKKRRKK
jgi:hypothetical protein